MKENIVAGSGAQEDLDGQGIRIPAEALDITKHNGFITLRNPATGGWRTIRIRTFKKKGDPFNGARRVALLGGPDNGTDYHDFGFITRRDGRLVVYPSKRGTDGHRSFFEIVGRILAEPARWQEKGVEFRISGICRRCNRRLTVPASIDSGLGPECRKSV